MPCCRSAVARLQGAYSGPQARSVLPSQTVAARARFRALPTIIRTSDADAHVTEVKPRTDKRHSTIEGQRQDPAKRNLTPVEAKRLSMKRIDLENIKVYRMSTGRNQSEFWCRLGVTQSGSSRYENGRRMPPPLAILVWLCENGAIDENALAAAKRAVGTKNRRRGASPA